MQRTKRSLNDHRTHLTDSISFVSWVKDLVHDATQRRKGPKPRGVGEGLGRVLLYFHIYVGSGHFRGFKFWISIFFGFFRKMNMFFLLGGKGVVVGGGMMKLWIFLRSHRKKLDYFWELFLNILWLFLKAKIQNWNTLGGGGVANFQLFLGRCLFFFLGGGMGGGNSRCLVHVYVARKIEGILSPPPGGGSPSPSPPLIQTDSHTTDHGFMFPLWIFLSFYLYWFAHTWALHQGFSLFLNMLSW